LNFLASFQLGQYISTAILSTQWTTTYKNYFYFGLLNVRYIKLAIPSAFERTLISIYRNGYIFSTVVRPKSFCWS